MLIKDVMDLNFYRLNAVYRKIKDEITAIEKGILDLDTTKLKLERKKLDLNEQIRKIESQIINDIEKHK